MFILFIRWLRREADLFEAHHPARDCGGDEAKSQV